MLIKVYKCTLFEKADISTKYLYEVEAGKKGVSAEILSRIAVALEVSTDYILFGVDKGSRSNERVITVLEGMDVQQKARIHDFIVTVDELLRG